ncbi:hypothetical protein FZ934_14675 [Rhizobium grahamii]|uniref:FecR protein domain-containing protein n=1 Tax=Rhizobium grahamii TaxID=1120045 RepID=A0A5Q0C6I1_9HYPH|nr:MULTISPECIES: FecR domain-containing protein [Rhizobium]QFY61536.1 hypothetical protein FZ934_14675 [Rhizobium grahamii]QRM49308.1 hypothetical protein F3Y33_08215 [Rhizobium sp. BG6]
MFRPYRVLAALFSLVLSLPLTSKAAEEVGQATLIRTEVTGDAGPIIVKSPVHRDEKIRTSPSGLGQFIFRDGTKLAVGAGSSVVIDKYVYDDASSVKKLTIRAAKGTFRWISGSSSSSAYSIVTPAGTIGVRGTAFDFYVGPNGQTAMVLLNGEAEFCGAGGCKKLEQPCDCVIATRGGGVSDPRAVDQQTLQRLGNRRALPFLSRDQLLSGALGGIRTSCGLANIQPDRRDRDQPQPPQPLRQSPVQPPEKPDKPDKHHHHHDKHERHGDRHHHDRDHHGWGGDRDGRHGWNVHHDRGGGGWGQRSDSGDRPGWVNGKRDRGAGASRREHASRQDRSHGFQNRHEARHERPSANGEASKTSGGSADQQAGGARSDRGRGGDRGNHGGWHNRGSWHDRQGQATN